MEADEDDAARDAWLQQFAAVGEFDAEGETGGDDEPLVDDLPWALPAAELAAAALVDEPETVGAVAASAVVTPPRVPWPGEAQRG